MRKLMIAALALALVAPSASAQVFTEPATTTPVVSQYVVRPGDSVWELGNVRLNNPNAWRWIIEQNPYLQEPGRQYTRPDGTFMVLIRPGETLRGLQEVGVRLTPAQNSMPAQSAPSATVAPEVAQKTFLDSVGDFIAKNWWWLLLLLGIGFIVWFLRELSKDPVRSGAPQITGGVNDQTVRDLFERRGPSRGFTLLPGSIVRGRGYGRMMVSYFGGTEHPRNLSGETVYRARARFDDGREEDVFMLQGCGNDVRYGGAVYRLFDNFRFVEDEAVVEPAPEPVAEEVPAAAPAPTVLPVAQDDDAPMLEDGNIKIELKGAGGENGTAMVRITGAPVEGMTVDIGPRSFTMRWDPKADSTEG